MTQKEKDKLIKELTTEYVAALDRLLKEYKKLIKGVTKTLDEQQIHALRKTIKRGGK